MSWVNLKITSRCNQNCDFCYENQDKKDFLSLKDIKEIIDKLGDIGYNKIKIYGGEPTVRDDFTKIVEYATNKGFYTITATNGILLTENMVCKLLISGLSQIFYSLGDGSEEWKFKYLKEEIKPLFRNRNNSLSVILIVTHENITHLNEIFKWLNDLGIQSVNLIPAKISIDQSWYKCKRLNHRDYIILANNLIKWWNIFNFILDCSFHYLRSLITEKNINTSKESNCSEKLYIDSRGRVNNCNFNINDYGGEHYKSISDLKNYIQKMRVNNFISNCDSFESISLLPCIRKGE